MSEARDLPLQRSHQQDPTNKVRKIIHVDMDCYFAAVEELDNPSLKGKAVAVGGSPTGRGVLCTANYEARKYGVRSAMSSAEALKKCPHLIFIKPRGSRYSEISQKIKNVFKEFTPIIEPLSLDEAFLDVTGRAIQNSATLTAKRIKERIFEETGLTASAGVAPNKFLAKIASDWKKPNGLFTVTPEEAYDFCSQLPMRAIPGIGSVTDMKCQTLGLKFLGDIRKKGLPWCVAHFGKFGRTLWDKGHGIDERTVGGNGVRKSLGLEETYHDDLTSFIDVEERIPFLIEELVYRYKKQKTKDLKFIEPYKIFVKLKTHEFQLHTHEKHIPRNELLAGTEYDESILIEEIKDMFQILWERIDKKPTRLLGVGVRFPFGALSEREKLGQLRLL